MNELLYTLSKLEFALFVIGAVILIVGVVLGHAMINEYKSYLEEHWKEHFTIADFIKKERFFIFLFLALVMVMLSNLIYISWCEQA